MPEIAKIIVVVGLLFALGWMYGSHREAIGYARAQNEYTQKSAEAMADAISKSNDIIAGLKNEIAQEKNRASDIARGRDAAIASERGLRKRIDQMAADAKRSYPDLAEGSKTAGTAIDLLAHMLARSVGVSRQLAEHADASRNAGLTCEGAYDAVENSLSSSARSRLGSGE